MIITAITIIVLYIIIASVWATLLTLAENLDMSTGHIDVVGAYHQVREDVLHRMRPYMWPVVFVGHAVRVIALIIIGVSRILIHYLGKVYNKYG